MSDDTRIPWFTGRTGEDHPCTLYCFPHSGSSAGEYIRLFHPLRTRFAVRVLQLPGRGVRLDEPELLDMKTLAAAVADGHDFTAPYVFLGHSLGALTAHEVTGRLLDRGAPAPLRLIASGSPAPHLPPLKEPARHLPDRELAALLGRQHSPLPAEILADPEVLRLSLRAFRADLTVLETRMPSPVPDTPWPVPVTALRGRDDYVPEEHARQWAAHTARFTHRQVPGGHFPFRDDAEAYRAAVDALVTEAVHDYQEGRKR
ncbi:MULTISPECIES: thioesterase II family protein [unclassified Streptomyces]|uniref:thioesterase II family protein n=1 Tax=unclassified Streptomyces TaxID=2593676 RepID=UPI00068A7DCB|nr:MULTISPECIES: alpha/beta fold hydrolase [unclassified Streptomyces]